MLQLSPGRTDHLARMVPLFHDAKNPDTSNIEVATRIRINERVWKSAGGWSQSSASRATKAPPNNSAGTTLLRTTIPSPAGCTSHPRLSALA